MELLGTMYNLLLLAAATGEEWQLASVTHTHRENSRGDSGKKSLIVLVLNLIRKWHLHKN